MAVLHVLHVDLLGLVHEAFFDLLCQSSTKSQDGRLVWYTFTLTSRTLPTDLLRAAFGRTTLNPTGSTMLLELNSAKFCEAIPALFNSGL